MKTAQEARALLSFNENSKATQQWNEIEAAIEKAIRKDQDSIYVTKFFGANKVKLEELGYKIKYCSGDPRDFDPGNYQIKF